MYALGGSANSFSKSLASGAGDVERDLAPPPEAAFEKNKLQGSSHMTAGSMERTTHVSLA
jgi:hypothetical protein